MGKTTTIIKKVNLKELKGNEQLAKPILSYTNNILISEGTNLKRDYINKLDELGIVNVYIYATKEEVIFESKEEFVADIKEKYTEKVKNLLDRHVYNQSSELERLSKIAEKIVDGVLNNEELIKSMSDIVKEGEELYSHSINVCALSTIVALRMGCENSVITEIAVGSILHDIGLKYVEVDYLDRDMEHANKNDIVEFRKHVLLGYTVVQKEQWLSKLSKDIILSHHEHIDGSGYPMKLKGDKLRKEIEIVTVCDAYDHIICGIGVKRAKFHDAIEYILMNSGKIYDKEICETLVEILAKYPIGTKVRTNNGDIAVVVKQNMNVPDRPLLRIIRDKDGYERHEEYIDLEKVLNIIIEEIVT